MFWKDCGVENGVERVQIHMLEGQGRKFLQQSMYRTVSLGYFRRGNRHGKINVCKKGDFNFTIFLFLVCFISDFKHKFE